MTCCSKAQPKDWCEEYKHNIVKLVYAATPRWGIESYCNKNDELIPCALRLSLATIIFTCPSCPSLCRMSIQATKLHIHILTMLQTPKSLLNPYTWLYKSSHQKALDLCVGNALLIVLYESFKQFALGQALVNSTIHSPHGTSHIHNDPPPHFLFCFFGFYNMPLYDKLTNIWT